MGKYFSISNLKSFAQYLLRLSSPNVKKLFGLTDMETLGCDQTVFPCIHWKDSAYHIYFFKIFFLYILKIEVNKNIHRYLSQQIIWIFDNICYNRYNIDYINKSEPIFAKFWVVKPMSENIISFKFQDVCMYIFKPLNRAITYVICI